MTTSTSHPALHAPASSEHAFDPVAGSGQRDARHFVPVGWEEGDVGLCPCGEAVRWDPALERWIADRSLVVLVLTAAQARHLRDDALMIEDLEPLLDLQLALNEDVADVAGLCGGCGARPSVSPSGYCGDCLDAAVAADALAELEEDPDAPDDGKVLVAGVLYDAETGAEADPQ